MTHQTRQFTGNQPFARHPSMIEGETVFTGVHLLTYVDRLSGTVDHLREQLTEGPLSVFSGVHMLPFFVPFDGDDAGFDPVDHSTVDPRLGTWDDVRAIDAAGKVVTADLIVNHVSADSAEFQDWLARGDRSPSDGMFLTFDVVFPGGGTEDEITAFYRPRSGLPFTPYQLADGTRRLVWTTFMPSQVDVDVAHPAGQDYLERTLRALADGGVRIIRLDAVGYAIKTRGTDSFMTAQTLDFVREITAAGRAAGVKVLVEVHAHHTQQQAIAPLVDYVYDFAVPPLLLHSLLVTHRADRLAHWLKIRPANAITVLDTHDGIGVIDAGPINAMPGILSAAEMAEVFAACDRETGGVSGRASQNVAWADVPHQVNSTFYSVLGEDDQRYLLARAFQLFLPGLPQIYYVGLLAGSNDVDLFERTGAGREVNRHYYDDAEIAQALERDVVQAQLALVRLRTDHPAFQGEFHWSAGGDGSSLELSWVAQSASARLVVDLAAATFVIEVDGPSGTNSASTVGEVAASW